MLRRTTVMNVLELTPVEDRPELPDVQWFGAKRTISFKELEKSESPAGLAQSHYRAMHQEIGAQMMEQGYRQLYTQVRQWNERLDRTRVLAVDTLGIKEMT
jgi:hypothetical protein